MFKKFSARKFIETAPLLLGILLIPLLSTNLVFDNFAQPKWLAVYWLCCFCGLVIWVRKGLVVPRLTARQSILSLMWLLALMVGIYRLYPLSHKIPTLDRFGFIVLVLHSYWLFREKALTWKAIAHCSIGGGVIVAAVGLYQATTADFSLSMPYFAIASTFGHANMAAEFLGICLVLLFYLTSIERARWTLYLSLAAFPFILSYIFISSCRSVMLALALVSAPWFLRSRGPSKWIIGICFIVSIVGLTNLSGRWLIPGEQGPSGPSIREEKLGNANWRMEV